MKKLLPILIALPVFLLSLIFLRPEATAPVVVAATDLLEGHTLVASDVTVNQVPKSQAPQGAFSQPSEVIGKTLRVFRSEGDVIHPSHLGGEVITLAPDERAVAIHVTDAAGLAGLTTPGRYSRGNRRDGEPGWTLLQDGRQWTACAVYHTRVQGNPRDCLINGFCIQQSIFKRG